jgi:asparagine synthase (glutamine-hydrolysing)
MSMQAGIWHYDQRPVAPEQVAAFDRQLTMQGPDARGEHRAPGLVMLSRAFYITAEDALETQPVVSSHGSVLTWDGRLDNREEILDALGRSPLDLPTDAEIVAAALSAWDTAALPKLIGDWALAWWNPRERRLLLARDYIGIRKLYYLPTASSLYWSSDLAALVLHSGETYDLCDAYFAGYFTSYPEPQLTPYQEIQLVPPGGYIEATPGKLSVRRYWSFNALPSIRYKTDAEYEEHFRHVFRQSIRRRLRTAYPILADLSGGLDSSSIVCMAYDILNAGEARATINTLSMYSLEEPGGDERPYFTGVERHIGKTGTHMEVRSEGSNLLGPVPEPYFAALPGYFDRLLDGERRLRGYTGDQGNRVHFSGLGGDELLGGVQNPVPDLAWLLWHLRLPKFAEQLTAWALQRKTTVWSLLGRSLVQLSPIWLRAVLDREKTKHAASWLRPEFMRAQHVARRRHRIVETWRDWLPGPGAPDSAYFTLGASIAGYLPRFSFAEQFTLPYYDRDLVQFLFSIPGDQLLRPQQRRSLMRRGLRGIVPDVVLDRKTKWLGRRQPALQTLDNAAAARALLPQTPLPEYYVDPARIEEDVAKLRQGKEAPVLLLERVLGTCFLYDDLSRHRLWRSPAGSHAPRGHTPGSVAHVSY